MDRPLDTDGVSCTLPEFDVGWGFEIQPLGADGFLLVMARAERGETNARVFSWDGHVRGAFHAGDAIEDVQTSGRGDIWVSYFDEAVFGRGEFAREGLVCFDAAGTVQFRYSQRAACDGLPRIFDCYALNVASDDDVWLCYYADFPLVHLSGGSLAEWWPEIPVCGAAALAVHRGRVLFAGHYNDRERLVLLSLSDMSTQELRAVGEDGEPLRFSSAVGRGSRMYFLESNGGVHVAELD